MIHAGVRFPARAVPPSNGMPVGIEPRATQVAFRPIAASKQEADMRIENAVRKTRAYEG